jgi:ParB/RepB/Spo0J family partition protein
MAGRTATIPLSDIRENIVALRAVNKESEEFLGLRDSIRSLGVLNPPSVRPAADAPGKYDLVDGLHRVTAARDAGLSEVPVNILDINEGQVLIAQVMANVHKVETRPVEYSKQLVRILGQNPTMTASDLSTTLGKSQTWVSERLGLVKLHPDVAKLVDGGQINLSNAYPLAKLPPTEQVNFVDAAMTMQPTEFAPTVQARAKELRDAARQGRDAKPAEFQPVQHLRKLSEIKDALGNQDALVELANSQGAKKAPDVIKLVLSWVLSVDPITAAQQKERHAEREAKKNAQAAEVAAAVAGT